jgi:hypothetical protein
MSNFASLSTFYSLLSKLYLIALNLEDDINYEREDAKKDVLVVINQLEDHQTIFQKEGESNC